MLEIGGLEWVREEGWGWCDKCEEERRGEERRGRLMK